MANNSDYYRAQLEAQARGREHAQHIEEYARMCKMMIEESVPILIEQYMAQKKKHPRGFIHLSFCYSSVRRMLISVR